MSLSGPNFARLNATNYSTWSGEMEAWLRASGLWRLVSGSQSAPTLPSPPSEAQLAAMDAWEAKVDRAAGHLYLMVEPEQRIHFNGIQDDPVKMWTSLQSVHLQKRPGMRFNAYDDLFSIRKQEDESLQSLINRVEDSVKSIRDLRPKDFTLDKLDEELASMALIRALPSEEFSSFTSSLLLMDKLDKTAVHQAFVTEDIQRRRRVQDAGTTSTAFSARSQPPPSSRKCDFCLKTGHTQDKCWAFEAAQKKAQADAVEEKASGGGKRRWNRAKRAQEVHSDAPSAPSTAGAHQAQEFAGNASSSSLSPSSPLQLDADFQWLADTGGHFSYDPTSSLVQVLHPQSHSHSLSRQFSHILSWDGLCGVSAIVRGKRG